MRNAYEVLGLTPEATAEQINKAYETLASQLELSDEIDDIIELQQIQEAYELINTPEKQTDYGKQMKELVQSKELHLPEVIKSLKLSAPNSALLESSGLRPSWTQPRLVASSRVLINLPARVKRRAIYEFLLDRQNRNAGWVKLDLTRKYPSLIIDYSNPKNLLAAIALTKALGGTGWRLPNNIKPETEAEIRKLCPHGFTLSTYPVLKLAAQKKFEAEMEEQQYKTPRPQLLRHHVI